MSAVNKNHFRPPKWGDIWTIRTPQRTSECIVYTEGSKWTDVEKFATVCHRGVWDFILSNKYLKSYSTFTVDHDGFLLLTARQEGELSRCIVYAAARQDRPSTDTGDLSDVGAPAHAHAHHSHPLELRLTASAGLNSVQTVQLSTNCRRYIVHNVSS